MKVTGAKSGEIKGGAEDEEFKDQIELEDWNWTLGKAQSEAGGVEPSVFSFSKTMDRSSTSLLGAMASGEELAVVVSLEEASDSEFELVLTLSKVRVIDYSMSAKNDKASGEVTEEWVFNYNAIRFDYKPTPREGKMTAVLTRTADARTASPPSTEDEILGLARRLNPRQLKDLWPRVEAQAGQPAAVPEKVPAGATRH